MLSLYLNYIFKMSSNKTYCLGLIIIAFGLLLQGCGSLQKCRYSRGWNWSFERWSNEEVKPLKIKTPTKKRNLNNNGTMLKLKDTTLNFLTIKDSINILPISDNKYYQNTLGNYKNFETETPISKVTIIPKIKKNEDLPVESFISDEWGLAAFIFTIMAGILFLIVYAYSLFLFDTLGGIALTLLWLGRIFLIVRIFKFRKGKKQLYKNKGFGSIAILLTIIASYIIGYFMLLGFLDLIF